MVNIETISHPTFRNDGSRFSSGCISLSNGVDIWFSQIHPIKTVEEANIIAEKIITALNKEA